MQQHSKADLDPLEVVARVCGEEKRDAFWRAFSGSRLYVPRRVRIDHPIALAIGVKDARRVADEIGGIMVDVPTSPWHGRHGRRERIAALAGLGLGAVVIGQHLDLCERHVRRIISGLRQDGELPPRGRAPASSELGSIEQC